MFAPDQERTASELARVCRPGGRIGLVAHTPDGFIGQLFKTVARHVPPPAGVRSPIQWGTEDRLRELFDDAMGGLRDREARVRLPVPLAGGVPRLLAAVLRPDAQGLRGGRRGRARGARADLLQLIASFNRADDGTMVVPTEYLEAVIVKR